MSFKDFMSGITCVLLFKSTFRTLITFGLLTFGWHASFGQFNAKLFKEAKQTLEEGQLHKAITAFELIREDLRKEGLEMTDDFYYASSQILLAKVYLAEYQSGESIIEEVEAGISARASDYVKMEFEFIHGMFLSGVGGQLDESLAHFKKAYDFSVKLKNFDKGIVIRIATIDALSISGRYEEAGAYIEQLINLSIKTYGPKHFRVATAYSRMARNLQDQRRIDESLLYWKKTVGITVQEIDSTYLTNSPYNEYDSLSNFLSDVGVLIQQDSILTKVHPADLPYFQSVAHVLLETGHLRLAETFFRATKEVFIKSNDLWSAANSMVGIGIVYQKQFQLNHALSRFEEALEFYGKIGAEENNAQAWVYHNMAVIFGDLGQFDEQLKYNQKALKIRKRIYGVKHPELAASYIGLGSSQYNIQDWKGAIQAFDQAVEAGYNDLGYVHFRKGGVFQRQERNDLALFHYLKAIELSNNEDPHYADFCNAAGSIKFFENQPDSALHYYMMGIRREISEAIDSGSLDFEMSTDKLQNPYQFLTAISNIASAYLLKYQITSDTNYLIRSHEGYRLCSRLKAEIRTDFIIEADQLKFYEMSREIANDAINANLLLFRIVGDDKYAYEAFFIADDEKAQILLNGVEVEKSASPLVDDVLVRYSQLKAKIRRLKSETFQEDEPDSEIVNSLKSKQLLMAYQDDLSTLLDKLRKKQPHLYSYLTQSKKLSKGQDLHQLSKEVDRTLLAYFAGHDSIHVFKVDNEEIIVESLALSNLKESVDRFRKFVGNPTNTNPDTFAQFVEDGHDLYKSLIKNVLNEGSEKVMLFPDDFLVSFPFEVLLTEKHESAKIDFGDLDYLLNSLDISYASSASLLMSISNQAMAKQPIGFTAWAPFSKPSEGEINWGSMGDSDNPELPGGTLELTSLNNLFKGRLFYADSASEVNFKNLAGSSSILHIATHGMLDNQNPDLSHLVFRKSVDADSTEDNHLYIFEIYGMSLDVELAVLTACNSGAGEITKGEGAMSLARAFQYAGVKSVIMSLWLANDESTSLITHRFYENLRNGKGKGASLRKAKLAYLAQSDNTTSHPFYWSHLILSGNDSPVYSLSQHSWVIWSIWLFILGIIGLILIRVFRLKSKSSSQI